ncbi:hypothetical protein EQM14_15695 [Caproiciproducens sp. NJN-50]|uniref:hypothetical protein n=1 Tax=Acutalibacteraceae TaxID=3082771 RepID=UPI000FFDFEE5|nr:MULTISPECIES: hypothetical protein [Acutalibacteraceae]QAT51095.1 hypothetical protein EQM14_15695 [Caproiciproducens sp. NJN-50]
MNIFHFGTTEKFRRFRISAMLPATLVVGAVLGICFERSVGISLSDRLARRIGTANAQVVSCARSGPALTVTVDLNNAPQSPQEQQIVSAASLPTFQQGLNLAYYGAIVGAVNQELTSNPLDCGVEKVTVVCQYQGKTAVTLTGNAASAPFSNFEARYADGSTESIFSAESNSSAPAQ